MVFMEKLTGLRAVCALERVQAGVRMLGAARACNCKMQGG